MLINFLDLKVWNAEHSSVWRQILSRWGQSDYDDLTKRAERQATLELEWTANAYARNRQAEYPEIAEQLDILYHSGVSGLQAELKKTKDKFPKPE